MTLEELLAKTGHPFATVEDDGYLFIADAAMDPIADVKLHDEELGANQLLRDNYALLVHAANVLPEVVKALENLIGLAQEGQRNCESDAKDGVRGAETDLKEANRALGEAVAAVHLARVVK